MNAGDSLNCELGSWTFGPGVEQVFDDHVRKSVPGYDLAHTIICLLSDPFIRTNSQIVDIGCSTGTLALKLFERHRSKSPRILGIDSQENMVDRASAVTSQYPIEFSTLDIVTENIPSSIDVAVSVYTMQFIPPSVRQDVFNKIYNSLNWGGAFFLFEKVRAPDARFQDYISHAYNNYKLENFSPDEIIGKANSLVGTMEPFSTEGNIGLLKRAGFADICTVAKFLCFEGFLAIK